MPPMNYENADFDLKRIVRETFVAEILFHQTIDSTNNVALELCRRDDLKSPHLVLTSQQTSGRGRGSNQWWSAPGALTFSLVLHAAERGLTRELWPRASLTAGLSVCLALNELLPDGEFSLKWPNDVHLSGRKVCGILVEVGLGASDTLVVGIGVNVNNSFDHAPDELKSIATSLTDASGGMLDLTDVLIGVLRQIELQLSRLTSGDPGLVIDWQSRCALKGKTVEVDSGGRRTTGNCQGIDEDGSLILLTGDGPARVIGGVVSQIW